MTVEQTCHHCLHMLHAGVFLFSRCLCVALACVCVCLSVGLCVCVFPWVWVVLCSVLRSV